MDNTPSWILKCNKFVYFTIEGNPVPSKPDLWGIALGAMYGLVQGGRNIGLSPLSFFRKQSKWILKEFWGVNGRTKTECHVQAIGVLEWLLHDGHRSDPQFVRPEDREAAQDMLAWDLARTVMVARQASGAAYINDAETLEYIRAAAVNAQKCFSSWEDYGRHYLSGFKRWVGPEPVNGDDSAVDRILRWGLGVPKDPVKEYERAIDYLLTSPDSMWLQLDWRMPLVWPENDKPSNTSGGWFSSWRRANGGMAALTAFIAVFVLVFIGLVMVRDDYLYRHRGDKPAVAKTAGEEFSEMNIDFSPSYNNIIAIPVTASDSHAAVRFRYGVDTPVPNKEARGDEGRPARLPESFRLPSSTHFISIQILFDDGSEPPVRRFDVPEEVRRRAQASSDSDSGRWFGRRGQN
jgi:hypothetical protein